MRCNDMTPRGKKDLVVEPPSQNMHLQIATKPSVLCGYLANTNEELAVPPFAKLV